MEKLSKTSLNYCLSEYLKDLGRAGVRDFYRGESYVVSSSAPPKSEIVANVRSNVGAVVDVEHSDLQRQTRCDSPSQETLKEPSTFQPPTFQTSASNLRPSEEELDERARRSNLLSVIASDVARCEKCPQLVANRTQTVFGTGDPCAELLFLGEGPGAEEDLQGLPFVGRSGQLLTDMIEKGMGIPRSSVFICNVVRCRPPQNRNPSPDEANACRPFLNATLEVVRPKFICCLGSIAATNLLNVASPIGKLRGIVHRVGEASVVCTYHPAYLLRNPSAKRQTWEDLQLLMKEMGLSVPRK